MNNKPGMFRSWTACGVFAMACIAALGLFLYWFAYQCTHARLYHP